MKLGIAAALAAAAAGLLVVAAAGASERGRLTYCRNNLRKLGEMGFQMLDSEEPRTLTGRTFWQRVRVEHFTTLKGGRETWVTRFGGLNPFCCPVRAVHPLDLSPLSQEELTRLMTDPSTIDYRGPHSPLDESAPRPAAMGGDLEGNHGNGKGHILLIDLTVREVRDALQVQGYDSEAREKYKLSE
jgi:hypothetical protein